MKSTIIIIFGNKFHSADSEHVTPSSCLTGILSHNSLCSKNTFIFAELPHQRTDKTLAATASVEEGLQLTVQEALLSASKSWKNKTEEQADCFLTALLDDRIQKQTQCFGDPIQD